LKSNKVNIGQLYIGSNNSIAIQSMANTDTNNIDETIKQCKLLFDNGSELVRITVPSKKEVEKIKIIKQKLIADDYTKPIIADIHYNPDLALLVAPFIDKIRINPGNYIEKKHTSDNQAKLKLKENFLPLIKECKKYHTAIRIGANYGSLSERILRKYGNTPLGMVKSVEDFIEICEHEKFQDIVISMKASDPRIMVKACRLIQLKMMSNNNIYPQHLGVTEAGNGNDARIKSAIGIGTLLSEGIGDTIRVSLTEKPVDELPVAKKIVEFFNYKNKNKIVDNSKISNIKTNYTINNKYTVISDYLNNEELTDADFYFIENRQNNLKSDNKYIIDNKYWIEQDNLFPSFTVESYFESKINSNKYNFIIDKIANFNSNAIARIEKDNTVIIIADLSEFNNIFTLRNNYNNFVAKINNTPIIIRKKYTESFNDFIIKSAGEVGSVFIDKLAGGLWLQNINIKPQETIETTFSILQATKVLISKTEYISCPTCGRTKFDIEAITTEIKQKTSNFKGVTIAIMGCIVNGPGEMADANYGYVGAGNNLVHLYKNGKIFMKNINPENAVDLLLEIIKNTNIH